MGLGSRKEEGKKDYHSGRQTVFCSPPFILVLLLLLILCLPVAAFIPAPVQLHNYVIKAAIGPSFGSCSLPLGFRQHMSITASSSPGNVPLEKLPQHIAFILDGNGRWAEQRGLPRSMGHLEGAKRALELIDLCRARGIKMVTYYCLSTENWHRPSSEVSFILDCVEKTLRINLAKAVSNGIRINVLGQRERLPPSLQGLIQRVEEETRPNQSMTVCLALSYGGRQEIVEATKAIAAKVLSGEMKVQDINEEAFEAHLPSTGQGMDSLPDLVVRTSGESRLSNFLLYQTAYSELHICPTLWPDYGERDLDQALDAYASRERRYGSLGLASSPASKAEPTR